MDNNDFDNNFEPQIPFTDKGQSNPNITQQNIQSEAVGNDSVNTSQEDVSTDYSQPVYRNSYNNGGYPTNQYRQADIPPQSNRDFAGYQQTTPQYTQPPQGYTYQNYAANPNVYQGYQPPQPAKKKLSGGIIAIIVILCVLLASSLTGFLAYLAAKSDNSNNKDSAYGSFNFAIPEFTDPTESITEEPTVGNHIVSDYSDKINSSYGGLKLAEKPKDANNNSKYTAQYAFNSVSDSVVGVVCYSSEITTVEECASQGSGIIVTSDGYVITNSHVIGNSKTAYLIQIVTSDGTVYDAGVVGFDSRTDLAVLKIDGVKNLKAATFGNSATAQLGEDIIVVGNPGGLDFSNSTTKGIISALDRKLSSSSLVKYIQTDAAINPGNSGGPIVNMYGQVIGIATSKIVNEKYEGMGFAIPSVTTKTIVDELIKQGYVSGRVKIGITGYAVDSSITSEYELPKGILVESITEGGPCDGVGLEKDDIIIEADGQRITSFADIYEVLGQHKAGDKMEIKYYRYSSDKEYTAIITLQEDK